MAPGAVAPAKQDITSTVELASEHVSHVDAWTHIQGERTT